MHMENLQVITIKHTFVTKLWETSIVIFIDIDAIQ